MNKAEELIACLEGEIANRDEELAACRVAAENCEVFRARIAELEARIVWLECEAQVNAAPVSEAKAQGVVQWPEADEIMQMAFEEGHPADDASGYYFELEEFDLFIDRLMSEVARLNAAPAAPAADASDVLEQAMYTLISIGYHENSGLVHELRQALAANRAHGVV